MSSSLGRVTARLAEPNELLPTNLVDLINRNIKPPTELTAEDVHIRAMYIVSDRVNSFGGRFPRDEHPRLAELLVDSPVLVGHRKDRLPVGRNFHAETVERDGQPWVKCYFYWLRSSDTEDELRGNIDGGIYKECSIAFTFNLPACSICGRDIRRCEHEPFETYEVDGSADECHFEYREIDKVLETSLVYRGAVPETSITKQLSDLPDTGTDGDDIPQLTSFDQLDQDRSFLIVPRYDGLPLTACWRDGALSLTPPDGTTLAPELSPHPLPAAFRPSQPVYGLLVGYQGRARYTRRQVEQYLSDRTGPVTRLTFWVFPQQGVITLPRATNGARWQMRLMPHRIVAAHDIDRRAREVMTRDGVELWPLHHNQFPSDSLAPAFVYQPSGTESSPIEGFRIEHQPDAETALLQIASQTIGTPSTATFEILAFDSTLAGQGRSFIARPCDRRPGVTDRAGFRGSDNKGQKIAMRPIRLGGENLYMVSCTSLVADRTHTQQESIHG